jgi:hypothetical protein
MSSESARLARKYIRLEGHKGVYGLASEIVGDADDGSLSDTPVKDQGRLDLGSGEAVSRDVDDI